MKTSLALIACCTAINLQALECEQQFENEQMNVWKVKIPPHEETELHRDVLPQVVIALKGGIITRIEADGRLVDVNFPTGVAVYRDIDPENELHKSINKGSEAVELIVIQLKNEHAPLKATEVNNSHDITVDIKISCPLSDELKEFVRSIPPTGNRTTNYKEWKCSFVNSMTQLINLIESEKVFTSWWSAKADEDLLKKAQQ